MAYLTPTEGTDGRRAYAVTSPVDGRSLGTYDVANSEDVRAAVAYYRAKLGFECPEESIAEAGLAKAAGAEFVVVSLHWGNEYRHEPTSWQNERLAELLPSDEVDLIIGHHAHVVQPVDKVGDEWVVFGLGNFVSNQSANCCVTASQDGMIATVQLLENKETGKIEAVGVHYVPTWVDRHNGYIIRVAEPGREDVPSETANQLDVQIGQVSLGRIAGLPVGILPAELAKILYGSGRRQTSQGFGRRTSHGQLHGRRPDGCR